jgi:hypothetical protein
MNGLIRRMLPELNRFPTFDDARRAYKRASWQLLLRRQWWLTCVLFFGLFVIANYLTTWLLSTYMNRNTVLLWKLIVSGFAFPICIMAIVWLLRRHFQHSLRKQLVDLGISICVQCGYDLTGNVSGVCPECGENV